MSSIGISIIGCDGNMSLDCCRAGASGIFLSITQNTATLGGIIELSRSLSDQIIWKCEEGACKIEQNKNKEETTMLWNLQTIVVE